jgi:hypothetical protein
VVLTWCCVVVLLMSFVVSVVYNVKMKTQEQGFGIGQWIVAVLTTMLAALYFRLKNTSLLVSCIAIQTYLVTKCINYFLYSFVK